MILPFRLRRRFQLFYAVTKDENILQAHQQAVEKVIEIMQKDIYVRDRSQEAQVLGSDLQTSVKGFLVRFDHFLNRNLEPQLHSHVLACSTKQKQLKTAK